MNTKNGIRMVIAAVLGALAAGAVQAADGYDDARVVTISVQEPGAGGDGKRKATCTYGYQKTGTTTKKIPWTAVQFYLRKTAGSAPEPYDTQKSCVGWGCVAHSAVPDIAPPGRILGCRVVDLQNNATLKDAIVANNFKETFVSAAAPARSGSFQAGSAPMTTSTAGAALGFSGNVKQCQTSLAATVTPSANQFAGALNGPADFAPATVMLHLKSSQSAGNSFVCRYASQGKDVPDFAVSIQCPNAAPRAGAAHTYGCTH